MARTKASVGAKISAAKSNKARCSAPPPSTPSTSGTSDKASRSNSGGNPVCPRETPNWQKPITSFFGSTSKDAQGSSDDEDIGAGSSKSHPKQNIIQSDNENECPDTETPKNHELDETFDLEPLTGDKCRKVDEYYTNKDKGKGKKSKNKEKLDLNANQSAGKRSLEESEVDEEQVSKKVKIS